MRTSSGGFLTSSDPPFVTPLIEPGLVWTCWQTDDHVVLADTPPPADAAFRWLHLDLWDQRSARWTARQSGLPADLQELFLSADDQPRALATQDMVALVLPDFEREFDREETERIGALHVAVRPGLVLTGRRHPLHTPDIIRHRAAQSDALDAGRALELILDSLAQTLATRTGAVLSELLAVEDQILADRDAPDTRALVTLRRITARLHRMVGTMHNILLRTAEDPTIEAPLGAIFARAVRRMQPIERDVVAAQAQLRLLREELDLQAGQRTNENVYLLSVITALIMPATLVTGFFGMNTGGMPLEKGDLGTLVATLLAVVSSLATWLLLRMMGLVRR